MDEGIIDRTDKEKIEIHSRHDSEDGTDACGESGASGDAGGWEGE